MNTLCLLALSAALATPAAASPPSAVALAGVPNLVSPEPGVMAAGRLAAADVARARDSGIRHIIDLTPDAETPHFDEAAAVREAGLGYSNLPLAGAGDLTRANVAAFDTLVRESGRPLLVHCASGNRVGAMAALRAAWLQGLPADDAVAVGKAWGLAGLEGAVRERIAAGE